MNNYVNNFHDTEKHISFYKANNNILAVYKKTELISELSIEIPKFNYENCYSKIKSIYNITEDLIIVLQYEKMINGNNRFVSHTVYDPRNGKKILYEELCKDEPVVVEENIENKIPDIESFVDLTNQGIDLYNPDSAFYTDICYHYKSPIDGKDIPLKERFKLFFPNASLCDKGCSIKGINTTTNASICECSLNKLINNEFLEDNIILGGAVSELKTLIEDTNIEVLKCYGDITDTKLFKKNYGSFIILALIVCQIIFAIIYFTVYITLMTNYLYNVIENILSYVTKKDNNTINSFKKQTSKNEDVLIEFKNAPPKMKPRRSLKNQAQENEITRTSKKAKTQNKSSLRKKEKKKTKSEFGDHDKHNKHKVKIFDDGNQENGHSRQKHNNINHDTKSEFLNHKNISNEDEHEYNAEELKNRKHSERNLLASENNSSAHLKRKISAKSKKKKTKIESEKVDETFLTSHINIDEYMISEPDDMDYDNAIKRDQRTCCGIFIDKVISRILILNIIFNYEPLNPRPIKIILLVLNFELYFFINGLFFNEDYLKELLYDKDSTFWDFIQRFAKRISYIAIIGIITGYVIDFFFFEERTIKRIYKREKDDIKTMKSELYGLIKNIKIRYCIFIILCFIFGVFIWYYIFCFNNIYPSMIKELVITTIIIYIIMQIIYLIITFLETIIRLIALKCKSERLFKISQFLS